MCKVLLSDYSEFYISIENQGPRVWGRSGKDQNHVEVQCELFQSVMVLSSCHPLVLVHCVFSSPQSIVIYQNTFKHLMLPSADQRYGDANVISIRTWTCQQKYQLLVEWRWCDCGWLTVTLSWPELTDTLSGIIKRKMIDPGPIHTDHLKDLSKTPRLLFTWAGRQVAPPGHAHKDTVIHVKGEPIRCWVHINEHILFQIDLVSLILYNIVIFWDTEFSLSVL